MMMSAASRSSSSKRLRNEQGSGVDAALLRAVLSQLPHRAARGHILRSWQKVARCVTSNAGGSLTGDSCRRRYVDLLAVARRESMESWPAGLRELLSAALVEYTQWKIETGVSDPDSVARHTRGAMAGIKQKRVKVEVGKKAPIKKSCESHAVVESKLEGVVARLDKMEALRLEREKETQEKAATQNEELKRTVVEAQEKVAVLGASLLVSEEAHGRLKQELEALRTEFNTAYSEREQVQLNLSELRASIVSERDDRHHKMTAQARSTEWLMGVLRTDLTKMLMDQRHRQDARMTAKNEEIFEGVRRELKQRDDLLLSMQRLLETYERQQGLQDAHRKSELAEEERKREEHQAEVHDRLLAAEQELRAQHEDLKAVYAAQTHHKLEDSTQRLDVKLHELQAALNGEIHERTSENTKLLLSIRRILTTRSDSDTESE